MDQIIGRLRRRGQQAAEVRVRILVSRNTVEDCVVIPRVIGKGEGQAAFTKHLLEVKQ